MDVTCLSGQGSAFEMRALQRMADVTLLSPERLLEDQRSPLVLFGEWHEQGHEAGLKWLAGLAYRLSQPCILCPPFNLGSIDAPLGLSVGLEVEAFNSNRLIVRDTDLMASVGHRSLRIQTDYAFNGPAGNALVEAEPRATPVVTALQPRSTATPLVLCGVRLFSSTGLSESADREALVEGLVNWAAMHSQAPSRQPSTDAERVEVSPAKLRGICVLLAGIGASTCTELASLADAVLGLDLSTAELQAGLNQLSAAGVVSLSGEAIVTSRERLEARIDAWGLRSYVRMLRSDFGRRGEE